MRDPQPPDLPDTDGDADAALRESEARLRAMFEQASVGIVQVTLDGRMHLPNPGFCTIIGYPEDEARRLRVRDVTHPEDYDAEAELTRRLIAGEIPSFTIEKRYRRKDGQLVWGQMTTTLVRQPSGEPLSALAIVEDITERKRAEAALREREAHYRMLLQNLPDYAIFRLDPDGYVTEWTEGAERVKGYTAAEVLGQHLALFFTPEAVAAGEPARELAEAAATGRAERESWRVRKGGERFWVNEIATAIHDADGRLLGFTKISRDLTERRQAEEALRANEAKYRTLFDSIDEGFCVIEVRFDDRGAAMDYRFLEVNRAFDEQTGLRDAAGRWMRALAPTHEDVWFETYGRVAATGEPARFVREAQALGGRWFDVYAFPLGEAGDPRVAVLFTDITERRQLEAEHERLAVTEAVAVERQALLKRVVAAQEEERRRVAHEVHDSVTQLAHAAAIRLDDLAERLPASLPADDLADLERARDLVRQAAQEARRLIAGLRPEALDDFGLAGAVVQEVDALRAAGWPVSLEDGELVGVRLPPETEITLYRVAQEALANVRKHAAGARVAVELRRRDGGVRLRVRDWGPGFEPARVRAGAAAGEQVGLVGMRERLALLGGRLEVRSRPGQGTTITAILPLSTTTSASPERA